MTEDLILRGDYERATDQLIQAEFYCPTINQRLAAAAIQARLYELSSKPKAAIRLLERFQERERSLGAHERRGVGIEQARLFLLDKQIPAGITRLRETQSSVLQPLEQARKELDAQRSSAVWYGLASAIVPGSGQVLQGEPMNAVSALFMMAIPTYFAIEAKRNDEHAFAASMTTLAGFFYLGNIASSYRTASLKHRNRKKAAWHDQVNSRITPLFKGRSSALGLSVATEIKLDLR